MSGNNTEQSWMCAVAFAEAGEWETARSMIPQPRKSQWARLFEQAFMAAAFAEEGLPEEAKRIMDDRPQSSRRIRKFLDSVGLRDARATYGVVDGAAW